MTIRSIVTAGQQQKGADMAEKRARSKLSGKMISCSSSGGLKMGFSAYATSQAPNKIIQKKIKLGFVGARKSETS